MSNPYEPPRTLESLGAAEGDGATSRLVAPGVSVVAYLMALVSGVFVAFGVMVIVAFSHLFVGDRVASLPRPVLASVPFLAIGLGIMSGWQSLRQARRKVEQKRKNG